MKPKTKLQIEVNLLSKKAPRLTKQHQKWASETLFDSYIFRTKTTLTCFECGHTWSAKGLPAMAHLLEEDCPKCKRTLKSLDSKKRKLREWKYFSIIDVVDRFQVIRFFHITKYWTKDEKPYVWINEVCQHWISPEGKNVIRGLTVNGLNSWGYNEGWCFGSELQIRGTSNRHYVNTEYVYPNPKFIKETRRNGFKGSYKGYNPAYFFELILGNPMAETLLKAKQTALFSYFSSYDAGKIKQYWSSIKICMRNKYIIKDASIWFDHLKLLEYFHMDIRNPKYICPSTLDTVHTQLSERKQRIMDRDAEMQKKQRKAEDEAFKKAKRKLLHLIFSNAEIQIVPLKTIKDFKEEGEIMKHCVYASEYHKKIYSLIMSARLGEERLATIEIDLRDFKVSQCRGSHNTVPERYDEIVSLITDNMNTIKKAVKLKVA